MAKQTFVADAILTAAQMNALQSNDFNQTVSTKTASYVLVASDAGTKLVMNAGATNTTLTVNTSLFAAGDTLTILNISTSGTCTITAGTATVSTAGSLALGLNQGGTLYFTSAGVSVFQADGISSKIGQVVYGSTATNADSSSSTHADTGLTATITPTKNTSTILVMVNQGGLTKNSANSGNGISLRLLRGATDLGTFAAYIAYTGTAVANFVGGNGFDYVDSPATTSATTYKTQFASTTNTGTVSVQTQGSASTIVLMEILA